MSTHTNGVIAMRVNHRLPRLNLPVMALTGAAVIVAFITAGGRGWLAPGVEPPRHSMPATVTVVGAQDQSPPVPADVALTTLNTSGFAPAEITHAAGRFRVVVQNRSGAEQLDLRLDGEQSSRWSEQRALGEIQGWVATVELEPGTFTITEARHPEWVCRLTVQ